MFKGKNWFGSWGMKSKQVHSLEHLKVLYTILHKNQTVNENNKHQLVETLRSIAEILIWGDQNDSSVFDFFLEKNMLSFFLKIMKQKCGSYICVQLLQTLNILFENIRDETSLYYLLSNNHVNSIIVHKFDFSDEEVMAYYISFLKTLSFKLNDHTIHFFFNEHTNDFPLYTEAIKFFNHNEKMVRIAVRTLTLNVFKVEEKSMLKFVGDHTAVPYFSNLVWFIGNHVLEIDNCLKIPIKDQQMLIKLDDLVAEHLDHLHYLNDILLLRINDLNEILTDHLLNRLLIPLYIYSLIENEKINFLNSPKKLDSNPLINNEKNLVNEIVMSKHRPKISKIVSLFLLSQVFLIISYDSLVQKLVDIIINGNFSIFEKPEFTAPHETLEQSLVNNIINKNLNNKIIYENEYCSKENELKEKSETIKTDSINNNQKNSSQESLCNKKMCIKDTDAQKNEHEMVIETKVDNIDDKLLNEDENLSQDLCLDSRNAKIKSLLMQEFFKKKPFLEAIYKSFDFNEQKDDHLAIFSLSLLYAIIFNTGIKKLDLVLFKDKKNNFSIIDQLGSNKLIDQLTRIINLAADFGSFIRPITLELSSLLLLKLCMKDETSNLSDHHLALIEQTKENATSIVRAYYKKDNEQIFLELFEDEYLEFKKFKINVEYLMMDANLLIPPKQLAPLILNGLHFTRRSPYSISEKTRFALRVFFVIRNLSLKLTNEPENELPLTNNEKIIMVGDTIDSTNCELVHCFLVARNQTKEEGFISLDSDQLLFMEPNSQHLGSIIVKYTANLQNVNVCLDKDDFRSLLVTIRPNSANGTQTKFGPADLNSGLRSTSTSKHKNTNIKLLFDDYIRCKVFEQHIFKEKENVIFRKLKKIADLIDLQYDVDLTLSSNNTFNNQTRSKTYLSKSQTHAIGNSNLRSLSRHHPQSGFAIPGVAVIADNKNKNSPTTSLKKNKLLNLNSPSVSTAKNFDSNNLIQTQSNNLSNEKNISSSLKNNQQNSELKSHLIKENEDIAMSDLSPKIQRKDSVIKNKMLLSNDILELSKVQKNLNANEEINNQEIMNENQEIMNEKQEIKNEKQETS